MHVLNKIIMKHSVRFYSEAWTHRNEVRHEPAKYKEFVIRWYENVKNMGENDDKSDIRRYVQAQEIDIERCDSAHIRQWIIDLLKIRRIAKTEIRNNI